MKRATTLIAASLGLAVLLGATAPRGCGGGGSFDTLAAASSAGGNGAGSTAGKGPAGSFRVEARLGGFQEIPAISTTGNGSFRADLASDGMSFTWELSYADLEGNAGGAVTGAHIHLGQRGVAGGIAVHLCGGGDGTEACPDPPAMITGTFMAANVVGPAGQGLSAGELSELIAAMRAGVTYVNVHTTAFQAGEIRGQLRAHGGRGPPHMDDDDDDDD